MYYTKYVIPLIFLSLFSCKQANNKSIPDVRNMDIQPVLHRFESELFNLDTQDIAKNLNSLNQKYPAFSKLYFEKIVSLCDTLHCDDPKFQQQVKDFLADSAIQSLYNLCQHSFSDFSDIESQITQSSKYYSYYFPNDPLPDFYTLISEYSVGSFIFQDEKNKNALGIGLDFFLGNKINYKNIDPQNPAFSDYLSRSFNKEHLVKKTWEAWMDDKLGPEPGNRFLDYLIHRGKKIYGLSSLLPYTQDSVIFEYSGPQVKWCKENELQMWSFFLDKNLIYETDQNKFRKFVNPSPNSPGMPPEAPGQTGNYIGYRIILSFMQRHPEIKLESLLENKNTDYIFKESKYKPK